MTKSNYSSKKFVGFLNQSVSYQVVFAKSFEDKSIKCLVLLLLLGSGL